MISARVTCFILMTVGVLFLPLWLFISLAFLYALVFSPYELIFLSVLVDAEFGNPEAGVWYAYTLSTACILLLTVYAKPYLRFYQ